jgi:predicted ATPase
MLKHLRIQNFKGWEDTGFIKLAPITLFFGSNSSGKSSIGQFLMMLKQTMDSSDRKAVFYPGGTNSAVRLGSFQEMVSHHDKTRKISFEYEWSLPKPLEIKAPNSKNIFHGDTINFSANVGLGEKEQNILYKFVYNVLDKDKQQFSIGLQKKPDSVSLYDIIHPDYDLIRNRGRGWSLHNPGKFYAFPDEVVAYYQNADFVQEINFYHEKLFRSMYYLGSLRTKTERLYTWTRIEPESVGYDGQNAIAAILAAEARRLNYKHKSPMRSFQQVIMEELHKMGLIEDFKVLEISKQRQDYEVKIKTKGSLDWVDLPDVGFGISQVLPVLVQCFYAPPGSIILMEQPEIHLHPSAQSALADVMIDVINSGEDSTRRNIQLIIETHSEHFLRRLQRRIADGTISQDKVSVYFANINKTPATLDPLEINMFGEILNWPENFFGDEMKDITEQAKAAIKKRIAQNKAQEQKVSDETLF